MLNRLNAMGKNQYETGFEEIDREEYLKHAMMYDRKETLQAMSKVDPFVRTTDLDIEGLGCKIQNYKNNVEHLFDPFDFYQMLINKRLKPEDKNKARRKLFRLISKQCIYIVNAIDEEGNPVTKHLIDSDGVVYMLMKAQEFNFPHAELLLRAFARTINVFTSFMGITLSDYIASVVSCQAIKPLTELPVATFAPQTDKIKFRFVSEYVLDKNNKVLLGDEEDLYYRLKESRKARKYMFYFDTSDNVIIDILTKLYPDILIEEIQKVMARLVDQAKIKYKAIKNYNTIFITDNMLWDLVSYCEGGIPNMKPVVEALIEEYKMDEEEQRIFIDSFYYLHDFDYACDITFFDKYKSIMESVPEEYKPFTIDEDDDNYFLSEYFDRK